MAANSNYIVAALKAGFDESQIASGLGITQSAVKQEIDSKNLKQFIPANSRFRSIDEKYNNLEESVLDKLEQRVAQSVLMKPLELTRILSTLNGAKRRSLAEGQAAVNQTDVRFIQLQLPESRQPPQVKLNANSEVIEVDGRVLKTLPSAELAKMESPTAIEQGSENSELGDSVNERTPRQPESLAEILKTKSPRKTG